jgi:hypothetical protein
LYVGAHIIVDRLSKAFCNQYLCRANTLIAQISPLLVFLAALSLSLTCGMNCNCCAGKEISYSKVDQLTGSFWKLSARVSAKFF